MVNKYVLVDKGQQEGKHDLKHKIIMESGYKLAYYPLPVGDYTLLNDKIYDVVMRKYKRKTPIKKMDFLGSYSISVDTKRDIQEIIGNVCGKSHERFRDEVILAKNNNITLYILIENEDHIRSIDDLVNWENPRLKIEIRKGVQKYPNATKGSTLAKVLSTMQDKYGCVFLFCTPGETGKKIIELLERENKE